MPTKNPSDPAHRGLRNWYWAINRDPSELEWVRADAFVDREVSKPVVLVNGVFDILHAGHMKVLSFARERAGRYGTVVCAMDSDRLVRETKGADRPILNWIERATALGYMPIDFLVEIDSTAEMVRLVRGLRPDLRVQGGDYVDGVTRFPWLRKMFVQTGGMRTSEIVRRCREGKGIEGI
jgi:cytidyltransferase-like protein